MPGIGSINLAGLPGLPSPVAGGMMGSVAEALGAAGTQASPGAVQKTLADRAAQQAQAQEAQLKIQQMRQKAADEQQERNRQVIASIFRIRTKDPGYTNQPEVKSQLSSAAGNLGVPIPVGADGQPDYAALATGFGTGTPVTPAEAKALQELGPNYRSAMAGTNPSVAAFYEANPEALKDPTPKTVAQIQVAAATAKSHIDAAKTAFAAGTGSFESLSKTVDLYKGALHEAGDAFDPVAFLNDPELGHIASKKAQADLDHTLATTKNIPERTRLAWANFHRELAGTKSVIEVNAARAKFFDKNTDQLDQRTQAYVSNAQSEIDRRFAETKNDATKIKDMLDKSAANPRGNVAAQGALRILDGKRGAIERQITQLEQARLKALTAVPAADPTGDAMKHFDKVIKEKRDELGTFDKNYKDLSNRAMSNIGAALTGASGQKSDVKKDDNKPTRTGRNAHAPGKPTVYEYSDGSWR